MSEKKLNQPNLIKNESGVFLSTQNQIRTPAKRFKSKFFINVFQLVLKISFLFFFVLNYWFHHQLLFTINFFCRKPNEYNMNPSSFPLHAPFTVKVLEKKLIFYLLEKVKLIYVCSNKNSIDYLL